MQKPPEYKFSLTATAQDKGQEPKVSIIDLDIRVVQSHKKAPSLTKDKDVISIPENFNNYMEPIVRLKARSNINDRPDLAFELVSGRTEQTNKEGTFR